MTFQLPTIAEKHDYVREQFDRIAQRYDLTNDAISFCMHRSWKKKAVRALMTGEKAICEEGAVDNFLQKSSPLRFLDVCCGTGDLAIRIAAKLREGDEVVGLDFSSQMLEIADDRGRRFIQDCRSELQDKCSLPKLSWKEGDAQNLPFADDEFDGAIISFGLRNLTDIPRGLKEMARCVRPGGRVVNLDLGEPDGFLFEPSFKLFFKHIVPIIGEVLQSDRKAYTYLPESMNTYPKPGKITSLFYEAGMTDVKHFPLAAGSVALHVGTVKP